MDPVRDLVRAGKLEEALELQISAGLAEQPERQFRFAPPRRYRADFCWPERKLLVEVDGGLWLPGGGRHNRAKGYAADAAKLNLAAVMGYRVLRVCAEHIEDGRALCWIQAVLAQIWREG